MTCRSLSSGFVLDGGDGLQIWRVTLNRGWGSG